MDFVLFPNSPAARGRKTTGNADDQNQDPCHNGQDLVDQQLILVMRFPSGEGVHYVWQSQSMPCRTSLPQGRSSQALALSISTETVGIIISWGRTSSSSSSEAW